VTLAPELRDDDVAYVAAAADQDLVECVPDRHPSDDRRVLERKQEGFRHVIREKVHIALLIGEHFEIPRE
jgi:hypothetical protein